jgi:hypothetical protein
MSSPTRKVGIARSSAVVLAFEPATPTSRRLWEDVPIRLENIATKWEFGISLGLTDGMCVVRRSQRTKICMAGYGCIYGGTGV